MNELAAKERCPSPGPRKLDPSQLLGFPCLSSSHGQEKEIKVVCYISIPFHDIGLEKEGMLPVAFISSLQGTLSPQCSWDQCFEKFKASRSGSDVMEGYSTAFRGSWGHLLGEVEETGWNVTREGSGPPCLAGSWRSSLHITSLFPEPLRVAGHV